jgi:hypothetical protein
MEWVPHYTTLQKFAARTPSDLLDRVLRGFAQGAGRAEASLILGIDASGFKPSRDELLGIGKMKDPSTYWK